MGKKKIKIITYSQKQLNPKRNCWKKQHIPKCLIYTIYWNMRTSIIQQDSDNILKRRSEEIKKDTKGFHTVSILDFSCEKHGKDLVQNLLNSKEENIRRQQAFDNFLDVIEKKDIFLGTLESKENVIKIQNMIFFLDDISPQEPWVMIEKEGKKYYNIKWLQDNYQDELPTHDERIQLEKYLGGINNLLTLLHGAPDGFLTREGKKYGWGFYLHATQDGKICNQHIANWSKKDKSWYIAINNDNYIWCKRLYKGNTKNIVFKKLTKDDILGYLEDDDHLILTYTQQEEIKKINQERYQDYSTGSKKFHNSQLIINNKELQEEVLKSLLLLLLGKNDPINTNIGDFLNTYKKLLSNFGLEERSINSFIMTLLNEIFQKEIKQGYSENNFLILLGKKNNRLNMFIEREEEIKSLEKRDKKKYNSNNLTKIESKYLKIRWNKMLYLWFLWNYTQYLTSGKVSKFRAGNFIISDPDLLKTKISLETLAILVHWRYFTDALNIKLEEINENQDVSENRGLSFSKQDNIQQKRLLFKKENSNDVEVSIICKNNTELSSKSELISTIKELRSKKIWWWNFFKNKQLHWDISDISEKITQYNQLKNYQNSLEFSLKKIRFNGKTFLNEAYRLGYNREYILENFKKLRWWKEKKTMIMFYVELLEESGLSFPNILNILNASEISHLPLQLLNRIEKHFYKKPNMTYQDKCNMKCILSFMKERDILDNKCNLYNFKNLIKLYNNIEYFDDGIRIWTTIFSRENRKKSNTEDPEEVVKIPYNMNESIFLDNPNEPLIYFNWLKNTYYFNYKAAEEEKEKMKKIGLKIPNIDDFEKSLKTLPWTYDRYLESPCNMILYFLLKGDSDDFLWSVSLRAPWENHYVSFHPTMSGFLSSSMGTEDDRKYVYVLYLEKNDRYASEPTYATFSTHRLDVALPIRPILIN